DQVCSVDEYRPRFPAKAIGNHQIKAEPIEERYRIQWRQADDDRVPLILEHRHDQIADHDVIFNEENVLRKIGHIGRLRLGSELIDRRTMLVAYDEKALI